MVRTLLELSAIASAKYINEGLYLKKDYKLNNVISDITFKALEKFGRTGFEIFVNEIIKKFNITNMSLNRVKSAQGRLSYSQTLTRFSWSSMSNAFIFQELRNDTKPNRPIYVNVVQALDQLLNPESRRSLVYLNLSGHEATFPKGWTSYVGKMLPSLETFSCDNCDLDNTSFGLLCENFPNLKRLLIRDASITTLNGIGKLRGLKELCLSNVVFQNPEDVVALFELDTLEILDCSQNDMNVEMSSTTELIVACGRRLPNLTFIDCAGNVLTYETLTALLETHPTLEKVSLVDTLMANIASQIPHGRVQFLSSETLLSCSEALSFYQTRFNNSSIKALLLRTLEVINDNSETKVFKDFQQCFNCLVSLVEHENECKRIKAMALDCMCSLIKTSNYKLQMSPSDKRWTVQVVFALITSIRSVDVNTNEENHLIRLYGWGILAILVTRENSDVLKISEQAARDIVLLNNSQLNTNCSHILSTFWDDFMRTKDIPIVRQLMSKIALFLEQNEVTPNAYQYISKVLLNSLEIITDDDEDWCKRMYNPIVAYLNRYNEDTIVCLGNFYILQKIWQKWWIPQNNFYFLRNYLKNDNEECQTAAILLLCEVYMKITGNSVDYITDDEFLLFVKETIKEYPEDDPIDGRLFAFIANRSINDKISYWAQWVATNIQFVPFEQ